MEMTEKDIRKDLLEMIAKEQKAASDHIGWMILTSSVM